MTQAHIHLPFPSINQFRNVVKHVQHRARCVGTDEVGAPIYDHTKTAPTLKFIGTVKLHGTNAAIVFSPNGTYFQSRERILSQEADNMGFWHHMNEHADGVKNLYDALAGELQFTTNNTVAVYGEWCGGSIQKGVALSKLPKMFVIFAVQVDGQWFRPSLPYQNDSARIYTINLFPSFMRTIPFETPEQIQNTLVELTEAVERECPVGKSFGVSGIGEGIVWQGLFDPDPSLWFKVKGEKHSASKVKTLAAVDVEAATNLAQFVENTVTEARLNQGLQNLLNEQRLPFDITSTGAFVRWVVGDIAKEEADTLAASNLTFKQVNPLVSKKASRWFQAQLNTQLAA